MFERDDYEDYTSLFGDILKQYDIIKIEEKTIN